MKHIVTFSFNSIPVNGLNGVMWCTENIDRSLWDVEFKNHGMEFIFKNEADAVWFTLIHSESL